MLQKEAAQADIGGLVLAARQIASYMLRQIAGDVWLMGWMTWIRSDFSATIFARVMAAGRVTMWKNTDGVCLPPPDSSSDLPTVSPCATPLTLVNRSVFSARLLVVIALSSSWTRVWPRFLETARRAQVDGLGGVRGAVSLTAPLSGDGRYGRPPPGA